MSVSEGKYYKYDQSAKWDANGFYFTNSSNGSSDGTNKTNIFQQIRIPLRIALFQLQVPVLAHGCHLKMLKHPINRRLLIV